MIILPHIEIIRIEDAFPEGMFGNLLIATRYFCATLEPPEFDNKKNFACIPTGQYECVRIMSQRFGTTYEILHIPNRDMVRFHSGFKVQDTKGCVCLGQYIDRDTASIRNSKATMTKFKNTLVSYPRLRLTIKEAWA